MPARACAVHHHQPRNGAFIPDPVDTPSDRCSSPSVRWRYNVTECLSQSDGGCVSTDKDAEAFRTEVGQAFAAIVRSLEVMQASLFITRAVVDLLDEHKLLPIGELRLQAHKLALAATVAPSVLSALEQLLAEEGPVIPGTLQ